MAIIQQNVDLLSNQNVAQAAFKYNNAQYSYVTFFANAQALTASSATTWFAVAYSPELNILVATDRDTNSAMYTTDAITWTASLLPSGCVIQGLCWSKELGIFVGVGTNGSVAYSSNGITWSNSGVTGVPTSSWSSVTWSPELSLFVAVASSGAGNRIMRSSNGISWTSMSAPEVGAWYSICWANTLGLFISVNNNGTSRVMTSPDGINWTLRSASSSQGWRSVAWAQDLGLLVAVADSATSSNYVMTSTDGINWTNRVPSGMAGTESFRSIAYSIEAGLFYAVGSAGIRIMLSPDGINWTLGTGALPTLQSVCWASRLGIFVGVGDSSSDSNRTVRSMSFAMSSAFLPKYKVIFDYQ